MRRVCTALLLLAAAATSLAAGSAALPPVGHTVAVIAHRGGAALAPENSLAAFRAAISLGCDFVEIDVRETADHQLVLMHDRTVDRTTNGTGDVAAMTLAQLRSLDAGAYFSPQFAGEPIPTLDDALALCAGRIGIYLDHKEGPVPSILRAIRHHRMSRQVIVYDGPGEALEWKRHAPAIPVMVTPGDSARLPGGMAAFAAATPVEVLDGHFLEWSADLVAEAHAAGRQVYVDIMGPTDTPAAYRQAIKMGADGIQTDRPDALLALLAEVPPAARGQQTP